jgi:hypothetical protein
VYDQDAHGNDVPAAVARGAQQSEVRPPRDMDVLPAAGERVAARGSERAVENRLDNPRIPARRLAATAVAPPPVGLEMEDRARRYDPDTERIAAALTPRRMTMAVYDRP